MGRGPAFFTQPCTGMGSTVAAAMQAGRPVSSGNKGTASTAAASAATRLARLATCSAAVPPGLSTGVFPGRSSCSTCSRCSALWPCCVTSTARATAVLMISTHRNRETFRRGEALSLGAMAARCSAAPSNVSILVFVAQAQHAGAIL